MPLDGVVALGAGLFLSAAGLAVGDVRFWVAALSAVDSEFGLVLAALGLVDPTVGCYHGIYTRGEENKTVARVLKMRAW